MKVCTNKLAMTTVVEDTLCDRCGASCKKSHNTECASLECSWGFESDHDMLIESFDICEACYFEITKDFKAVKDKTEDERGPQF